MHVPGVDLDSKLAFVEYLLSSTDIQASARRAVDWLTANSGVEQAIVAVQDPLSGHVLLVAEAGVSSAAIVDFTVSREDTAHPLVHALANREPTYFESTPTSFHSPLTAPFHAIPLHGEDDERADGLLLAAAAGPEIDADVLWVARQLGRQVTRLVSRTVLAETRFGQERMLLYSIINAVTD